MTVIPSSLVDSLFAQFGESDITRLSIREVGKLVAQIEEKSGQEFIHMEMGVPGLPALPITVEAEKEAERAGMDSRQLSFELFKNGLAIPEIARSRQMAVSTIESHLLYYVGSGKIDINRLVELRKVKAIEECIELNNFRQLSDLKAKLGEHYSYSEIRFVLKYLEVNNQ
jgi:uncharacterized protein YpbB